MIQVVALIGALLLVALNGFFVAAEFGLVKLRQTRVQTLAQKHGVRGKLLATVHQRLDAYLSACQLGITLASLGLGWIGEPAFADLLTPVFRRGSPQVAGALVLATAFVVAVPVIDCVEFTSSVSDCTRAVRAGVAPSPSGP